MEENTRELINLLEDPDEGRRLQALHELHRRLPVEALDAVSERFNDASADVRYLARKTAARIARYHRIAPRGTGEQHRLREFEGELQRLAAAAAATPDLEPLWQRFNGFERFEKITAIYWSIQHAAVAIKPLLLRVLEREQDPFIIATALKALGQVGGEACVEVLLPFLRHVDPRVRANAVEGLEATGSPRVLDGLLVATQDVDHRVKANALGAMMRFDRSFALGALERMVRAEQPRLRDAGLECLVRLGDEQAARLILSLVTDPVEDIRNKASFALAQFGEQVLQALERSGNVPADLIEQLQAAVSARAAGRMPTPGAPQGIPTGPGVPASPLSERERILLLMKGGELGEARMRTEFLLTRQPDNPEHKALLADIHEASGNRADALRLLEELLIDAPANTALTTRIHHLREDLTERRLWQTVMGCSLAFLVSLLWVQPELSVAFAAVGTGLGVWGVLAWRRCPTNRRGWLAATSILVLLTVISVGQKLQVSYVIMRLHEDAQRMLDSGTPCRAVPYFEALLALAPGDTRAAAMLPRCRFLADRQAFMHTLADSRVNLPLIEAQYQALVARYGFQTWFSQEIMGAEGQMLLKRAESLMENGRWLESQAVLASPPGLLPPDLMQQWGRMREELTRRQAAGTTAVGER